jgi:hypothetical protein
VLSLAENYGPAVATSNAGRPRRSADTRPHKSRRIRRRLRKLRVSGMAATLEARLRHAQSEKQTPIDLLRSSATNCSGAGIGSSPGSSSVRASATPSTGHLRLDFNKKMNGAPIHERATARVIAQHEDALYLGAPGTRRRRRC